ncbi:hypothetical protein EB052_00830 [bacterium]|nr:hypothetical protein [bacterium]
MAPGCIMLDHFYTDMEIKKGNEVFEIHRFLGVAQKYVGSIIAYEPFKKWAMDTRPIGKGPFPLPHRVLYSFSGDGSSSNLTIDCTYELSGVLRLPIIRHVVQKTMNKAVDRLLNIPGL